MTSNEFKYGKKIYVYGKHRKTNLNKNKLIKNSSFSFP